MYSCVNEGLYVTTVHNLFNFQYNVYICVAPSLCVPFCYIFLCSYMLDWVDHVFAKEDAHQPSN